MTPLFSLYGLWEEQLKTDLIRFRTRWDHTQKIFFANTPIVGLFLSDLGLYQLYNTNLEFKIFEIVNTDLRSSFSKYFIPDILYTLAPYDKCGIFYDGNFYVCNIEFEEKHNIEAITKHMYYNVAIYHHFQMLGHENIKIIMFTIYGPKVIPFEPKFHDTLSSRFCTVPIFLGEDKPDVLLSKMNKKISNNEILSRLDIIKLLMSPRCFEKFDFDYFLELEKVAPHIDKTFPGGKDTYICFLDILYCPYLSPEQIKRWKGVPNMMSVIGEAYEAYKKVEAQLQAQQAQLQAQLQAEKDKVIIASIKKGIPLDVLSDIHGVSLKWMQDFSRSHNL